MVNKLKVAISGFINFLYNKKIVIYGAGLQGERMAWLLTDLGFSNQILAFVDNDLQKQNLKIICGHREFNIISLEAAYYLADKQTVFLITSLQYKSMFESLEKRFIDKEIDCIVVPEVSHNELQKSDYDFIIKESDKPMIPKVIHYVWMGSKMPDNVKRNIDKWREICPDFEFKQWDESNYDVSKNTYMKQAYEKKIWGFVSDYIRLDVVYNYGGIYLDTDIEMVRNPEELLYQKCFGCVDASFVMNTGSGFGAVSGFPLIKELRDYYDNDVLGDKSEMNVKKSCNTHNYMVLRKYGMKLTHTMQSVHGMNIYPMIFQGAAQYTNSTRISNKTFWIHHERMSWF
ncbi:MAG: hypothetical protein MRZ65_00050 [Lachnospiraceae bacterium]|nr:hypothetical protein [Lachnospiraceae bacterium]